MAAAADFDSSADLPLSQRDRIGSVSLGQSPMGENGDNVANNDGPSASTAALGSPTGPPHSTDLPKEVQDVLQSEIGISTMLNRLKQSIAAAKEFATFLKKRGQLEQDHSNHLKKLAQMTIDTMARSEHRQGTFASAYAQMMETHNRMADNGMQFGASLHQMHEDLLELAAMAEKNRKGWKANGLAAESRVAELEAAMRKSKAKYESLAEEYDRVRTGDTGGQRGRFGLKGHKSAAQQEEDLLRKVQAADQDYHGKVQTVQTERRELINSARPEAVKALHDTIRECDSGVALQIQKFASFNEKLLLSNGLSISPLKGQSGKQEARSLREIAISIDNEQDLNNYIGGYHSKLPPQTGEPVYERHPVLESSHNAPPSQGPSALQSPTQGMGQSMGPGPMSQPASMSSRTGPIGGFPDMNQSPAGTPTMGPVPIMPAAQRPASGQQHERSFSHSSPFGPGNQGPPQQPQFSVRNSVQTTVPSSRFTTSANSSKGPPQLGALSFQTSQQQQAPLSQPPQGPQGPTNPLMSHPPGQQPRGQSPPRMAPAKPVFGLSLQRLYDRDGLAVPMVVNQCIQAVDLYGLSLEGIYRLSGSVPHVNKLKAMFDTGDSSSANIDFRNPENFFHDVNSVAGLLKHFLRDLPDPLLTKEHYSGFVEAAKNDDDIVRRDSLHAIINSLPDPNYATLRALTLHLHRVMENSKINRMNSQNLAIVFGPTLMGTGASSDIADAGWQVRAVDTILQNTYQIFDDD